MDPGSALAAVQKADEALGLIAKLMAKLRAQPDLAAVKLSAALDEVAKTYSVVDAAFNTFVAMAIDEGALTARSKDLLAISGGSLTVQVEKGRGDCSKIYNIYEKYLRRWFERVVNPQDQLALEKAFIWPDGLGDADDKLFRQLIDLTKSLQGEARAVVPLIIDQRHQEARTRILHTYHGLAPVQQAMGSSLQTMFALKNDLILLTGAT